MTTSKTNVSLYEFEFPDLREEVPLYEFEFPDLRTEVELFEFEFLDPGTRVSIPLFEFEFDEVGVESIPLFEFEFDDIIPTTTRDYALVLTMADGTQLDIWPSVSSITTRWGRSEISYLARCVSLNGILTIWDANHEINHRTVNLYAPITLAYKGGVISAGWVASIRNKTSFRTGQITTELRIGGSGEQLLRRHYDFALFQTDAIRTHQLISNVLSEIGWPAQRTRIDFGQVKIHPAHYARILSPRVFHQPLNVIRGAEEAEVGFVHEGRGNYVVFEDRFHRELDDNQIKFVFGDGPGTIPIEEEINPENVFDNLRTVITVGASRSFIKSEGLVWSLPVSWRIPEAGDYRIDIIGSSEKEGLRDDNARTVASWTDLTPDNYTWSGAGVPVLVNKTRSSVDVRLDGPGILTKLELHGRAVALYGDITLPEVTRNVGRYGRLNLDLDHSFIGDGYNEGGDYVKEGRDFAEMLLLRFSEPRTVVPIIFDPERSEAGRNALTQMEISDLVSIQPGYGADAGEYYVEGGAFQWNAHTRRAEMTAYLSTRGSRIQVRQQATNVRTSYSVGSTNFVAVGSPIELENDKLYVVAMLLTSSPLAAPATDNVAARIWDVTNRRAVTEWTEQDIPINDRQYLAHLVRGEGQTIRCDIAAGPSVEPRGLEFRVVEVV